MVAAMFTRKAVAPYGPRISQIAEELLDAAMVRGRCDIIDDFAGPLTVATIALLLGIPVEDVERLRQLTRQSQDYVLAIRLGKEPTVEARSANNALLTFMRAGPSPGMRWGCSFLRLAGLPDYNLSGSLRSGGPR